MARIGDAELLVALASALDGDVVHAIGLGVRPSDAEGTAGIMRRVRHGKHDVDVRRQRLPMLADLESSGHRCRQAEHVDGALGAERAYARTGRAEEFRERLLLAAT